MVLLLPLAGGCGPGASRQVVADPKVLAAREASPSVRWLSPQEACADMQANPDVFLLCVATKEEYDLAHIAGSVLMPALGLQYLIEENRVLPEINQGRVPRKDQPIICYCHWKACICPSIPTRSHVARKVLLDKGFRKIAIIAGGMKAWAKAGLPVEKSPPRSESSSGG